MTIAIVPRMYCVVYWRVLCLHQHWPASSLRQSLPVTWIDQDISAFVGGPSRPNTYIRDTRGKIALLLGQGDGLDMSCLLAPDGSTRCNEDEAALYTASARSIASRSVMLSRMSPYGLTLL